MQKPLLTIAIPTFNRLAFLSKTVARLREEWRTIPLDQLECIISDNASTDGTSAYLDSLESSNAAITIIRNASNIGADANTAQCFDRAKGDYVLVLGDDDLLVQGSLARLITRLQETDYGIVCLRPYGYDVDDLAEYPAGRAEDIIYDDPGAFLSACGAWITFISACVINKSRLPGLVAADYTGGHLVQMHLVLRAALSAPLNLMTADYRIACKRNNSGGYDFAAVFVDEFSTILDRHAAFGLTPEIRWQIERAMIIGFYPMPLWRQLKINDFDRTSTRARFDECFFHHRLYRLFLRPILAWPRPYALLWGGGAVVLGRLAKGDLRRGLAFLRTSLGRRWMRMR